MDKVTAILDALESQYHNEENPPELGHPEPLDGLILTILSQNTNDKNRDRAFANMKTLYPTWPDVIRAGASRLEEAIRTAGLAHTKAGRIITVLERVHSDFGEYSILGLAGREREYVREYLRALPGVGAKTVACTMLFDFKIPAFPVDTHITRISRRTGIAPAKSSPEEISRMLEGIVPEARCLGGHVNMIAHGRAVCHSQRPECGGCVISHLCDKISL
ncbi:MAG: endonuclease III [Synergistaceae bacterium]|nr:endonuclease III [Synergistaceae bacterium]MBQ3346037.1 endonuclease III [Synergistaceae bacterium]MBQ3398140.1 endonuclease III [Synergistaceae bacterium]MBQ3758559.1 endonuclease III [Synergistaceae bacterium]MBQ4402625.1 endonuclease III [Synergistaceae bacterium]